MKTMRTAAMLMVLALAGCAPGEQGEQRDRQPRRIDEPRARQIAERAFRDATQGDIGKYSVGNAVRTNYGWEYLIKGEGEFERPGFHWVVRVDQKTGSTVVRAGE
jgi:hypothetical protein